jgi:hypothetical protein
MQPHPRVFRVRSRGGLGWRVTDCEMKELRMFAKVFGMMESSKPLTFRSILPRQPETGDIPKVKQRLVIHPLGIWQ